MILVDTNVVSEVMRPAPSPSVLAWLNGQDALGLFLSTVSIAEIGYGIRVLPEGKRRRELEDRFERFVAEGFGQRILGFDEPAARIYPAVMARRREMGRPMGLPDGQIAAIARANRCVLATRNIRDFEACGLELINPFGNCSAQWS